MAKGELFNQQEMRRLWGVSGLGLELAGAILILTLIGWGVDRWLNTSPWFTLVGAVIGTVGGGYNFIRHAKAMSARANAPRRGRGADAPGSAPAPRGPDEFERLLAEEKARDAERAE